MARWRGLIGRLERARVAHGQRARGRRGTAGAVDDAAEEFVAHRQVLGPVGGAPAGSMRSPAPGAAGWAPSAAPGRRGQAEDVVGGHQEDLVAVESRPPRLRPTPPGMHDPATGAEGSLRPEAP